MNKSTIPNATFTLFPLLPLELRLKIWILTLDRPRLIKVIASQRHWRNPYSQAGWSTHNTPIPISLHICHESRQEALKYYQLAFGSPFCGPKVYIDFSRDTIRFGNGPSLEDVKNIGVWVEPSNYVLDVFLGGGPHGAEDYEKVQRMVLDVDESLYGRRSFCWDEIRLFVGLKDLTLLVWEPDYVEGQLMPKYRETLGRVKRTNPEWEVPRISVISAHTGTQWGMLEVPTLEDGEDQA